MGIEIVQILLKDELTVVLLSERAVLLVISLLEVLKSEVVILTGQIG